jgi:formate/nitrite transporter FocA (FNT family)
LGLRLGKGKEKLTLSASDSAEILRDVIADGQSELERATPGLAFSGFVAGLNVSFGAIAMGIFAALTGGMGLVPILFSPLGFLIVILGKAELFTAHTVSGVAATLKEFSYIRNLVRLWVVIFVFNLLGAIFFAALVVYGKVLPPSALGFLLKEPDKLLEFGFWSMVLKGVLGGWLVALMPWLAASTKDTITEFFSIYALALLIPAAGLPHCIVGSSEFLMSIFSGDISPLQYLGSFLIPTTIGNVVGGIGLVTLLNWGQVLGSKKKTSLDQVVDRENKEA